MTWHNGLCWHGHKVVTEVRDGWTVELPGPGCTICTPGKILTKYKETFGMYQNRPLMIVLSGGQDSTTSAVWALDKCLARADGKRHDAVFFDYGQRHLETERQAARDVAEALGLELHVVTVESLKQLGDSSLTNHTGNVNEKDPRSGLPTSFTPGRNLLFLTLAAALAYKLGHEKIQLVTGVCQTDYSGYPDCRADFIRSAEICIGKAINMNVDIHTPLMWLTKAQTVKMMAEANKFALLEKTHTCYMGRRPACGVCPSCVLRLKGFAEAGFVDPIAYENNANQALPSQAVTAPKA